MPLRIKMKLLKNLPLIACTVMVLYVFLIFDFEPDQISSTHQTVVETTYQWVEFELKVSQVKQEIIKVSQDTKTSTTNAHSVKARNVPMLNNNERFQVVRDKNLKYVLLWSRDLSPFHLLQDGTQSFQENKCTFRNCYLTGNVSTLYDQKDFDAVIFSGFALKQNQQLDLFKARSPSQKYVFAQLEPAPINIITNPIFDNFFNWTWTYKLTSSIPWRYFTIHNLEGKEIGPKATMMWPDVNEPISSHLKKKIDHKTKPIAWFVSHCVTQSRRESFVVNFEIELNKYGYSIDVYGKCGPFMCRRPARCYKMLVKEYFFYLAFENSLDDDYVTEKLSNAMNNLVVPVAYGGANYTRFLPPGSYIDARELGPKKSAAVIDSLLKNKTSYYDYFRWRNHLRYKSAYDSSEICGICNALNEKKMMKYSSIKKFREWWNGPTGQQNYNVLLKKNLNNTQMIELDNKGTKNQSPAELLGVSDVYEDVEEYVDYSNIVTNTTSYLTNSNFLMNKDVNTEATNPFSNMYNESPASTNASLYSDFSESSTLNSVAYSPQSSTVSTTGSTNVSEYFDYELFKVIHSFIDTH